MIDIKDIQEKLINKKDNSVKLHPENKYTQRNAYQMTITYLEKKLSNNSHDISSYTNLSTKISQVNNRNDNINNTRNDNQIISNTHNNTNDNQKKSSLNNKSNKLIYNDTDIIDIPEFLLLFFNENNIEHKEHYLYGIKNNDSFFTSLILLSEPDYIIKSRSEKLGYISSFKRDLAINLNNFYKKFNYKHSRFSKDTIINELINTNDINYSLQVISIDYIKTNSCIIDIEKKNYLYIETETDLNSFYIIIKLNDYYLPVMNIRNNHLFDIKLLDFIKLHYSKYDFCNSKFKERNLNQESINLKAITYYKIADLKELACKHNINIKKDGNKNKTKK